MNDLGFFDLSDEERRRLVANWLAFVLDKNNGWDVAVVLRGNLFGVEVLVINIDEWLSIGDCFGTHQVRADALLGYLVGLGLTTEFSASLRKTKHTWVHGVVLKLDAVEQFVYEAGLPNARQD